MTTSLYSQTIDLSNDMIDKNELINQKSFVYDVNATKPCIIIQWNVVLDMISKTPFPIFSKYIVWDNKAMSSVGLIPRGCELHKKIDNYYKNIKFDV